MHRRPWVLPLGIYLLGRCASALLLLVLGRGQGGPTGSGGPRASFSDLLTNWDGDYYLQIAAQGYPGALPRVDGAVVENVWAFYPLFPGTVGLLGRTGLPLPLAATIVSTACGAAAMVLLFTMLAPLAGRFTAALTVAAFSFGATSLVLQTAYTESMALLEILAVFVAMRHRRHAYAAVLLAALALTRPVALPVAAVLGVTWLMRMRARRDEPFPRREAVAHAALAVGGAASFAVWPLVCGLVTGELDGYAQTQRAWAGGGAGGWGTWLSPVVTGEQLAVLVVSVPVLLWFAWLALRRPSRVWGPELRAWVVLYPLYILAVSRPTTSVVRYLALTTTTAWPFPDLSARARTTRARIALVTAVVAVGLLAQWAWIDWLWVRTDDWIPGAP